MVPPSSSHSTPVQTLGSIHSTRSFYVTKIHWQVSLVSCESTIEDDTEVQILTMYLLAAWSSLQGEAMELVSYVHVSAVKVTVLTVTSAITWM